MKRFCSAFFIISALFTGITHAQVNVTSEDVTIESPLFVKSIQPMTSTTSSSYTFKIQLGECGLEFGYPRVIIGGSSSRLTIPYMKPTVSHRINLGSSSSYFNNIYVSSIYSSDGLKQSSDARLKENIFDLKNSTFSLMNLRPVSFDFKPTENTDTANLKNKVGFLAQEVQKILPHLVTHMEDVDIYTLDYISLIPYLVKGFQEEHSANEHLRQQVEEMQESLDFLWNQINEIVAEKQVSTPMINKKNTPVEKNDIIGELSQNTPNPFSQNTTIEYFLPIKTNSSIINVYSATGSLVRTYVLPLGKTKGMITVESYDLAPGIYTYLLITDGYVLDSKRMIITE